MSVLLFMSFISLKFLVLPSVLYIYSANTSWIVVLTLMIIDGIYAILLIDLMQKSNCKNINEFMLKTIGPVLTKVIFTILALQFALQLSNITKGLEFFVTENFYNEFSWILFSLPLAALVGFMIYKGIRNIARVQEMFYLSIVVGCIYIACKSLSDVDPLVYMPFFKDGALPLFQGGFQYLNWFGSSTFLIPLFGKIDFTNSKKRTPILFIIFAILLVQLLYFVFYGLFDSTSPTHTFAIGDISQYSSSKSFIDELSWLVVSLWVVTQSIQIALYGYCLMISLMYLFKIKSRIFWVCVVDLIVLGVGFLGSVTINLEQIFFSNLASITTLVSQYVIPLILLIGYKTEKRKNLKLSKVVQNEKIKNNI